MESIDLKQAALVLGMSSERVIQMAEQGHINCIRPPGCRGLWPERWPMLRFDKEEVTEYARLTALARKTIPRQACELNGGDRFACVYFLIHGFVVVYVGATNCLVSRLGKHHQSKKVFDRVMFLYVEPDELYKVESRYIKLLQPKYNVSGNAERSRPTSYAR